MSLGIVYIHGRLVFHGCPSSKCDTPGQDFVKLFSKILMNKCEIFDENTLRWTWQGPEKPARSY